MGVYNPAVGPAPNAEITRLLRAWQGGDQAALDQLTPLVYGELHLMALRCMAGENPGNSLQPTALVNEAYLRLVEIDGIRWQDRAHFFALSANMMRRILVDSARARRSDKRGGAAVRFQLNESIDGVADRADELMALDEALDALAGFDARKAQVIELRFFGGLSVDETAEVLKISPQSVMRDWKLARAWLMHEMGAK